MKNRYLKGAHITERKVREMLKLYCEDLTATQIANISGISRITVNAYLKLIRTHIAKYCEDQSPLHMLNGHLPMIHMENGSALNNSGNGKLVKKHLYGILKSQDLIYTDQINRVDPQWFVDWVKGRIEAEPEFVKQNRLTLYNGIADFNTVKLYRIQQPLNGSVRGRSQIDEIDLFWGLLKSRLVKFRGLTGATLYLHVKETEFRYNNRNQEIFDILMSIIHKRPLHFSRA